MIEFVQGNLLESNAEALVNTVNTVGVMGKGIALQFKEKFNLNFQLYSKACKAGEVQTGKMFLTTTNRLAPPSYIINFPTKTHWKGTSRMEFIEHGLADLKKIILEKKISSVALPPLGCGNGGLNWAEVKQLIIDKLSDLPTRIFVFEPSFQPASPEMPKAPHLTKARALILKLIEQYSILGFETTHLEIQKLAYFLQRFGQKDLRLSYVKHHYGPFAYNLSHLLSHLEGTYLAGSVKIADAKPFDRIFLIRERLPEILNFLEMHCTEAEKQRLQRVCNLIEGFESPLGLELLASVDWVLHDGRQAELPSFEKTTQAIQDWSPRKKMLMQPKLIEAAYERIRSLS